MPSHSAFGRGTPSGPQSRSFSQSTSTCEDWYGLGDDRCPSSYTPTGDLITDIGLIKERLAHYRYIVNNKQVRSHWFVYFTELLQKKQAELKIITDAQEKQREKERLAREKIEREQEAFLARIREEIIRSTAKPKETIIVSPPDVEEAVKYSPLLIAGIGIIVFIIILRRRA